MPRQRGFLKIEGKLDDVSFFKRGDEYFMRNKGGVSKQRIDNDPAFKRTRENGSEFSTVAKASKVLRDGNAVLIRKAYDGTLHPKLVQVLAKVKNCDLVSKRGLRHITEGLATPEGKQLLIGFDFNSRSKLRSVLSAPYALDTVTGVVVIDDLVPGEMLHAPQNSTHVTLQSAVLTVDFLSGKTDIAYSNAVNLPLDMVAATQTLTPTSVPVSIGTLFFVLLIEFYQEINGVQYALNNGNYNSLTVLDLV